MDREFYWERDGPLLALFATSTLVAMFGVMTLVSYTPVAPLARNARVACFVLPVLAGPLGYYWGYALGRRRSAFLCGVALCGAGAGCVVFYHGNGSWDTSPEVPVEAVVAGKVRGLSIKARAPYELRLELWGA